MRAYAVFKTAIYRHECGGVFSTQEAAEAAAVNLIQGERDDHHEYEVVPFELDQITDQSPTFARATIDTRRTYLTGGDLTEAGPVVEFRRKGGVVLARRGHEREFSHHLTIPNPAT